MVDIPEQAVKAALEQFNTSDMTLYDSYTKGQEATVRRMLAAAAPYMSGVKDEPGFEPYMRIVELFDKDETAGSFLNNDGEGGFVGGIYRMAREIDRLLVAPSAREQALEEAARVCERHSGAPYHPAIAWTEEQCQFYVSGQQDASSSIAAAIRALSCPDHADAGKVEGDGRQTGGDRHGV